MKAISLVIPGAIPVKANHYRRSANGGLFSLGDVKVFNERVQGVMAEALARPLAGPVAVAITLYPPNDRSDLAGCEKALCDAMQAWRSVTVGKGKNKKRIRVPLDYGCYANDKQIRRLLLEHGGVDKLNPRAEVTVQAMDRP